MKSLKLAVKIENLGILLIAGGVLAVGFFALFEVRVGPSKLVRQWWQRRAVEQESLTYKELARQVIPAEGKTVVVEWGDLGQKLVRAGAIDREKFDENFSDVQEMEQVLEGDDLHQIKFTQENIVFWTDVLWALGLTQKSKVLSEGPMMQNKDKIPLANYASTAGWTWGGKEAMKLYNSVELVELTPEQDELVYKTAENIFRPCCGNSAAYPDCNHGMAVLGLLTLLASQGASEEEMYQAALAFNSYAFSSTYIKAAAYLDRQGTSWSEAGPKEILGAAYSSGQGAAWVAKQVGEIEGAPKRGASCGA